MSDLSSKTQNHEVFLLSVAAIANITFLHKQSCSILLQLQAPRLLVMASSMPKASSLFAKDQVRGHKILFFISLGFLFYLLLACLFKYDSGVNRCRLETPMLSILDCGVGYGDYLFEVCLG